MNIDIGFVHRGTAAHRGLRGAGRCRRRAGTWARWPLYAGKRQVIAGRWRGATDSRTPQAQLVLKQACIDGTREFRAAPLEPIRLHLTDLKEN